MVWHQLRSFRTYHNSSTDQVTLATFFPVAGLFLWFFWRYFRIAQDIFLKLHANNYLIEDTMEQLLCEKCNRWVTGRVGRMKGFCYLVGFDDVRMRMCRFDWTGSWRIVSWKGRAHCAATTTPGATSVTNAESWSTPSSWSGRGANFAPRPRSSSTRSTILATLIGTRTTSAADSLSSDQSPRFLQVKRLFFAFK